MKKKQQEAAPNIKPGDHVEYDQEEWEVVELFGDHGKYATINGEAGRYSTETKNLKKIEE